jgi:hypothetical protein
MFMPHRLAAGDGVQVAQLHDVAHLEVAFGLAKVIARLQDIGAIEQATMSSHISLQSLLSNYAGRSTELQSLPSSLSD